MRYKCFNDIGIKVPEVYMPSEKINMTKWSVVACDQYTSEPDYWEKVNEYVDGEPSTLKLFLPEIYLESADTKQKIELINENMTKYVQNGTLTKQPSGIIYVERTFETGKTRKGLVLCLDLEHYDFDISSKTLIRATEGTVIDRLPPRMKIREHASLELPHIMVLIDDPEKTIIEPLSNNIENFEKLYDFDLMMEGGHIKGYNITNQKDIKNIEESFVTLSNSKIEAQKTQDILLYAMGDGNHSLAAAKEHWNNIKKTLPMNLIPEHPARYALVEIVNIHDEGIIFEPIHRVVFNTDVQIFLDEFVSYCKLNDSNAFIKRFKTFEESAAFFDEYAPESRHIIPFSSGGSFGLLCIDNPFHTLTVGIIQPFIDGYLTRNTDCKVDYIHGTQSLLKLSESPLNIGLHLPPIMKSDFFHSIQCDGILPRKTFSMGETNEKRFYIECRKITETSII